MRAAELSGTLDEAGEAELKALIELFEAEERERLAPTLARIREEQVALRQKVQESGAANEQLVDLIAQQGPWLADARHLLHDLQRRHQATKETYLSITGEPMAVAQWSPKRCVRASVLCTAFNRANYSTDWLVLL